MNHYVPDFEMDDDYSIATTSSALARPKRSARSEDEIMELLWQNGPVVMQNQTQKSLKKSQPSKFGDAVIPAEPSTARENRPPQEEQQQHHLFMQEDEMAAWLHYPLHDSNFDQDFCTDLLYPSPCVTSSANTTTVAVGTNQNSEPRPQQMATSAPQRPPVPPPRRAEVQNFSLFSRHNRQRAVESPGQSSSKQTVVRETAIVDSSDAPGASHQLRAPEVARSTVDAVEANYRGNFMIPAKPAAYPYASCGGNTDTRDKIVTCAEITVTSSPSGSTASADLPPLKSAAAEDRKRKGREGEEAECGQSEDAEFESVHGKKQAHGSTSTKRSRAGSRAAEVHNLSERRRRDRINEKMRALQELIPRCNKSDKASMLDEAIEYLKSLQLQVQMMSMGCGMVPMIFPGVQQYMPPMGMAMGMGMGMGMEMGINRPLMPFPGVLAGSSFPTPAAAAHLGPRFPMPAFHIAPVPTTDPSRVQTANPSDANPMLNPLGTQHMNTPQIPNFSDPYQQYLGLQQMQLPVPQNQPMAEPSTSKPTTSRGGENLEGRQSGT